MTKTLAPAPGLKLRSGTTKQYICGFLNVNGDIVYCRDPWGPHSSSQMSSFTFSETVSVRNYYFHTL